MGGIIEEQHPCPLSGLAGQEGSRPAKNHRRFCLGVCIKPDRFDTGFHPRRRLSGRHHSAAARYLGGDPPHSSRRMAGLSGIGGRADVRIAPQLSNGCRDRRHLGFGYIWPHAVDMAACQ